MSLGRLVLLFSKFSSIEVVEIEQAQTHLCSNPSALRCLLYPGTYCIKEKVCSLLPLIHLVSEASKPLLRHGLVFQASR